MALDLSSAAAIYNTTVGVIARERPSSTGRDERTDPHWGAMYRVDRGGGQGRAEASYSYLFYKIAGEGPLIGTRMPPEGPPLTHDEIVLVADWIARGAPND
jgi:hypothetical protein